MWEGKGFAAVDADAAETDWKHKVTPERGGLINRVNQWLSNWRTLCNCVLPACRWPSTYSTSGCMIWYDEGVSVVWIDTYPSRFFTLHIHFFSLNNAGNYNEFHICNGIWSKKNTINVVYYWHKFTQHKYYFWKHLLTVALIALSNKIFIICVPHFFLKFQLPLRLMSCHCVKPTKSRCYKLFNTLVPRRCSKYFKSVNFSFRLQIEFMSTSCENCSQVHVTQPIDESTLVHVMASCHQATNH